MTKFCIDFFESYLSTAIVFHSFKGDPVSLEVHAFQTSKFQGTAVETEEMRPQWFQEDQVAHPSEVGKMTTSYLRPIPLPLTQQVDHLAFVSKKDRVEKSMLPTFNLQPLERSR
jgi:hypothetical protein